MKIRNKETSEVVKEYAILTYKDGKICVPNGEVLEECEIINTNQEVIEKIEREIKQEILNLIVIRREGDFISEKLTIGTINGLKFCVQLLKEMS